MHEANSEEENNLTEQAMNNSLEAERAWMGASMSVKDFESGKNRTYVISFQNGHLRLL